MANEEHAKLRLNLGAGETVIPGWTAVDRKFGTEVYPLSYADNSVEEIRASHVLEHFGHRQIEAVLDEWIRVLKPGGRIKIAVPNAEWIADNLKAGLGGEQVDPKLLLYLMGGQTDGGDFHRSAFTGPMLLGMMENAGLEKIKHWKDDVPDASQLPVSLNLEGYKPASGIVKRTRSVPKVCAVMSVPRLIMVDNIFCALEAFLPLGIQLTRHTGVFWHQTMARCIKEALANGFDYVFTVDYDTVFTKEHAAALMDTMLAHPEIDALACPQLKRESSSIMFTQINDDGTHRANIPLSEFQGELTKVDTAHFGLTVFRADALRRMKKPWFYEKPDPNGDWDEGRVDLDIGFWYQWRESGNTLYQANQVRIGHMQQMVSWPLGPEFRIIHQYATDWGKTRQPPQYRPEMMPVMAANELIQQTLAAVEAKKVKPKRNKKVKAEKVKTKGNK